MLFLSLMGIGGSDCASNPFLGGCLDTRAYYFFSRSYLCLFRVFMDIKWILGSSPRMTKKEESPRVTREERE